MGQTGHEIMKNPISEEDWNAISQWLGNSDPAAALGELASLDSTVREKLLSTFSKQGNNSEYFLSRLFGRGKVFEAENQIYDAKKDAFVIPYGKNSSFLQVGPKGNTISFRPDLIWENEADSTGMSWLDMYDWKPDEAGGSKSIYQKIK